jgi:SAM-dependent methyltransferase
MKKDSSMQVLDPPEFYTSLATYMRGIDPAWESANWQVQQAEEGDILSRALGAANGRSVLDCSCGAGGQAIPLARLGWHVTGVDCTPAAVEMTRQHAAEAHVSIDVRVVDMRDLARHFAPAFDCVLTCMALDNLLDDMQIQAALVGMFAVLKPGGTCYVRLRDFDSILQVKPRYDFKEERMLPHGRVIRLEDWEYETDTHVAYICVFLHEDQRKTGYQWDTAAFGLRRRALRKAELAQLMQQAGFQQITYLPQDSPWDPYEVVATKSLG